NLFQEVFGTFSPQYALSRFSGIHDTFYRSISHLKKFIQVIGEYAQEAESLYQGNMLIGTFLQYPFIKTQPADLAVDILIFTLYHSYKSFGKRTFSVVPFSTERQSLTSNFNWTNPLVGTFPMYRFPHELARCVKAS